ncbi:MAG: phosphonate ABC transporter, permease protein PhnE [Deltaproteobacteria bacterium]|uniref:phosphonate ABC transporter, permease protein PhnE n=1 Tax=Desulfosarcina sp. BuS5 TaxID=933262 RepID=UPI000489DDA0|nr:phosphonate ABC transporter, permease protein PhnE [Desulfosarcina sp. BuS5]MCD6272081.1 phosphonate ABC transporter, permease protein PhnE [Deltaproteobacteria bacterium]WDN89840.1 phosphonate transport system permease protein [Desulfosarcina sp. BuS5]
MISSHLKLPERPATYKWIWGILTLLILFFIIRDLELNFQTLIWSYKDISEYCSRYGKPDFSEWQQYAVLMFQTIAIAYWGTVMAFVTGFIIAPFASKALRPNRVVYHVSRELLNFMRAMPDLLLALIFVNSFGLGPLPGILAIGLHTGGFLGKFFSESLDRVPAGVYEALSAVGADFQQQVMFAGWPNIMRETIGYTLYIFDRNVRISSVLGLVGAGGIGMELYCRLRLFDYNQSACIILFILLTIFLIDHFSGWLRKKIK